MPSSKGPTDNRREAAKERMAQAIREGDDETVTAMIREANARPAPEAAREGTRLDHHALTHLIAKARGREDAIDLDDNRLAEVLIAEMKAAGADVDWTGPDPDHYTAETRALLRPPPEAGDLRAAAERIQNYMEQHEDSLGPSWTYVGIARAALKESGS
jgi:hypothetical protein